MLRDVSMRVHESIIIYDGPHALLKTSIHTYIKWLKFISSVRWQGQNHNAIVIGIFNGLNCHVALCVVNDEEDFVGRRAEGLFLNMLQGFKETFSIHPATRLEDTLGTIKGTPHESIVPTLSWDYEDWRKIMASCINDADKGHCGSPFPRNL